MELQTKEVHRAVWVPRELVPRILDKHVLHSEELMDGMLVQEDGTQIDAQIGKQTFTVLCQFGFFSGQKLQRVAQSV